MRAGIRQLLLLLAVFTVVARCQQQPSVLMSPNLKQVFTGDLFYLTCDTSGDTVRWYKDGQANGWTNKTVRIAVASSTDSGSYECESSGQKSASLHIEVQNFVPSASLTIKTGQPVMLTGDSVVLRIEYEDGLQGWRCWVHRGKETKRVVFKLKDNPVSWIFGSRELRVPETIFWCTNSNKECRSNQVTIRTSDKPVSLEMYPLPAVVGQKLTLSCVAWGTNRISQTVFYRDDKAIMQSPRSTYEIADMTDSASGRYKCKAIYAHVARTSGPSYDEVSDNQEVFSQEQPVTALLSESMECSCPSCPPDMTYHYYKKHDESWAHLSSKPGGAGTFSCRAVWASRRTARSASVYVADTNQIVIIFLLIVALVIVVVAAVGLYIWRKSRSATGPIYEDVAMRLREEGDPKYETLQKAAGREAEYDLLQQGAAAAGTVTKRGEYDQLRKEEMKEGVYHTLGMEGAAVGAGASGGGAGGGEGGYEALKKEEMKEGVYHTLGMEGAAVGAGASGGGAGGGEGGYEALKKEEMKEGVYHTLGMEGAAAAAGPAGGGAGGAGGGEGGYEALKK